MTLRYTPAQLEDYLVVFHDHDIKDLDSLRLSCGNNMHTYKEKLEDLISSLGTHAFEDLELCLGTGYSDHNYIKNLNVFD